MKTNLTINQVAELLNAKVWNGKRIYMNSVGYNTKKMSTKAYYYLDGGEVKASVYVECFDQPIAWCESQAEMFKKHMMDDLKEVLPDEEIVEPATQDEISDLIISADGDLIDLNETVKGFYSEWREVRIAINRFGKLAYCNRQFLIVAEVAKKDASSKFQVLNDADFEAVKNYTKGEEMLEPYVEAAEQVRNILATIARVAEYRRQEEATALVRIENEKKEAEKRKEAAEKLSIQLDSLNGTELLKAWKEAGCNHPAPAMVAEFKQLSGLGWKAFVETI